MNVASGIEDLIGKTPMVELKNITKEMNVVGNIFGKCEFMNPNGSVKDRIALNMVRSGLEDGSINKDTHIIEPTSGNTGIGLASICARFGLKLTLTMSDSMTVERRNLMKAYGANIVLTPGSEGMKGAILKAEELQKNDQNAIILQQFQNPNNPAAHVKTTGIEILEAMDGKIDIFISAVGTGGSISGVGKVLRERNPNIQIIAVEPSNSAVLSGGSPSPHKIQGIGAGFIPDTLDTKIYDEVIQIDDEDAFATSRLIAQKEGILVGISAGANVYVALELAKRKENTGKNIVTFLCDTGERYLSTELFN